jgi:hypothetical protein
VEDDEEEDDEDDEDDEDADDVAAAEDDDATSATGPSGSKLARCRSKEGERGKKSRGRKMNFKVGTDVETGGKGI